jgi:hypothetical protein
VVVPEAAYLGPECRAGLPKAVQAQHPVPNQTSLTMKFTLKEKEE